MPMRAAGGIFATMVGFGALLLVTGAQDNTLRLWDVPQTRSVWSVQGHANAAKALARIG